MKRKFLSNRQIVIVIITVLILGLISAVGAKVVSIELLDVIDSGKPRFNSSIAELGKLIQKGENTVRLQQQLESVVSSNDGFGDLLVINTDATIIAARDSKAIGQTYPISYLANTVKGVPLPFNYQATEIPLRADLYKATFSPDQMFYVFGIYKAPDSKTYKIIGTYHVSPELISNQERITKYITVLLQVYRICFILFWLLLAVWVYRDAQRRTPNAAAWGILTLLTSIIGWVVYLIARPMVNMCPACGHEQSNDLKFCTACGLSVKICCPECSCGLRDEWEYCGACGHKLGN
ncbi:MAG: zinc ribbon domain-containing protein [Syntrophomonas sp.]|nr:zinc ribbon domain-containing protein [Syntrophomonas sp.]